MIYLYRCLRRAFVLVYLLCYGVYLLCYGYVLLLRLLCEVVLLLCCWFLCGVVCLPVDRSVEGSYLVRTFQLWVRPAMAVMLSVTRPLILVVFVVPGSLAPPTALGYGHHRLDIGVIPTRTQ